MESRNSTWDRVEDYVPIGRTQWLPLLLSSQDILVRHDIKIWLLVGLNGARKMKKHEFVRVQVRPRLTVALTLLKQNTNYY